MQVLNIFGDGQNCQNQKFKWLYQLNESKHEKSFFGKMLTVILFYMYQVFSSLIGHLHFSLHFFSTFMEQLFLNHPISFQQVIWIGFPELRFGFWSTTKSRVHFLYPFIHFLCLKHHIRKTNFHTWTYPGFLKKNEFIFFEGF